MFKELSIVLGSLGGLALIGIIALIVGANARNVLGPVAILVFLAGMGIIGAVIYSVVKR